MKTMLRTRIRRALVVPALLGALTLTACDILDVSNPNNLLETDVQQVAAANALVNGAQALVAQAVSAMWQPYLMASDELYWIGSRDAWLALDHGFISNPLNEFTDESFPLLNEARWMADLAVETVGVHAAAAPANVALKQDLARANLFAGIIYMVIGEIQQDFVFGHKTEPAPPMGPTNMAQVLDKAIQRLDRAVALASELGNAPLHQRALATRARAKHSRAIWSKIKPNLAANPLISDAGAAADAQAALNMISGDWKYQFNYGVGTVGNVMASWVNSRSENQFDLSLVNVSPTARSTITGIRLRDPIADVPDPVVTAKITEWRGGNIATTGFLYPPLTITSERLMRLILAEHALANGQDAAFRQHINAIRTMNGLPDYAGQIPASQMLQHSRRVNLMLMGLRLKDMYRFRIQDPLWAASSDVVARPGTLLPITIIEIRANPHLSQ
jgi:starch-binding outer membrane protein, SusD/RagB family